MKVRKRTKKGIRLEMRLRWNYRAHHVDACSSSFSLLSSL
jgi:hypothetical protein